MSIIFVFADCFLSDGKYMLILFLLFSFFVGFRYGTAEALFPFYLVLMLNNSMLETKIYLLGGISIGIIIKVLIWILFLTMLFRPTIRGTCIIPIYVYIIWYTRTRSYEKSHKGTTFF